ncbi:hypothetical protein GLE_0146 [Lysobacter enzymogenes]|uniref:Lipoprotein n=1 Tax=Lysobacter enzymogenes TaxID=69 RepID=A0A0S2DAP5_LYSEN|nr:hypothetical protein [Lysobacter enzymogenes]ALN55505.1 hypothetical protein GLE_0146 [Lysobacter enzymogenes]
MSHLRTRRARALLLAVLFATGIGFGAVHADTKYAEGCALKSGCQFGGTRFGCCVDDS